MTRSLRANRMDARVQSKAWVMQELWVGVMIWLCGVTGKILSAQICAQWSNPDAIIHTCCQYLLPECASVAHKAFRGMFLYQRTKVNEYVWKGWSLSNSRTIRLRRWIFQIYHIVLHSIVFCTKKLKKIWHAEVNRSRNNRERQFLIQVKFLVI